MNALLTPATSAARTGFCACGTALLSSRSLRRRSQHSHSDNARKESANSQKDFILSILSATPSARDSRFYLNAFAPPRDRPGQASPSPAAQRYEPEREEERISASEKRDKELAEKARQPRAPIKERLAKQKAVVDSILNPVHQHTGLVKIQGPFSDRQLGSVMDGILYLRKLGLVSILVLDSENWHNEDPKALREDMIEETMRVTDMLEERDARARPIYEPMLKLVRSELKEGCPVEVESLLGLRMAIEHAEIPVIPAFAIDPVTQISHPVPADWALRALSKALAHADESHWLPLGEKDSGADLVPLRMLIINREGGIPSPARGGNPHLSINLESEYDYIKDSFVWHDTHRTALRNLDLVRSCLHELPPSSQAVIVSHRSPKSLVANLITNRPAFSPSLHHSLLPKDFVSHTPTIVRKGRTVKVIRKYDDVDQGALTRLLEQSFGKTLDADSYYGRLRSTLDYVIVCGDYDAAAVVTSERKPDGTGPVVSYLDKFAALPTCQGDGTIDFLWGALRDESFGLGLLDALNPNGGKGGLGKGVDLVWRSRVGNPVNKWYFERSSGFSKIPSMGEGGSPGLLFWCDAEERIERLERENKTDSRRETDGRRRSTWIADEERTRLAHWSQVIGDVPSCWK